MSAGEGAARRRDSEISLATRRRLFLVSGAVLAALMTWALAGMPGFGDYHGIYGLLLNRVAVPQEHATNVITAVNFDYRGFDTLGEEFILFAAVLGLALILRERRDEEEGPPDDDAVGRQVTGASVAVRLITVTLVGPTVLLAGYIIAHGAITPGGGFQGGVIAATALLLVYLGGEYVALRRIRPLPLVEVTKATRCGRVRAHRDRRPDLRASPSSRTSCPRAPRATSSRPGRCSCSAWPSASRSPAGSCSSSPSSSTRRSCCGRRRGARSA